MPVLRALGLRKSYGRGRGRRVVLDDASLAVERGELVAVLGRSGSGKSTLLHLLGGLDRPDAGEVEVAGEPLNGRGERSVAETRRRHVGFVFQFFHLIPELTGEENLLVPARLAGGGNGAVRRAHELIARLGLADVRDRLPHTLSGGEQQRFALGRALVRDPELVLADEPTGNLDAESAATVLRLLRAAATEHERAVVLATHDAEAARMADRVVHLECGRLRAEPVVRLARAHHRP
jgi:ABC-type lipoprotein export system ATPase subunit